MTRSRFRTQLARGALAVLLVWSSAALAAGPVVRVLALFSDKAMLSVDGRQRLLAKGQTSPEGVELVAADTERAVVRIAGEELSLRPGGVVSASYAKPERREVRVPRGMHGAYLVSGTVNGQPVDFLVDTGASVVALGEAQARRLGIPFEREGTPIQLATASGVVAGYRVTLERVRVGEIELRNVEGSVILGAGPPRALLGMSFLSRLELQNQGSVLVIRNKF
jgi:aspartyl protease family protein